MRPAYRKLLTLSHVGIEENPTNQLSSPRVLIPPTWRRSVHHPLPRPSQALYHTSQSSHQSIVVSLSNSPCEHVSAHPPFNLDLTSSTSSLQPCASQAKFQSMKRDDPSTFTLSSVAVQKAQSSHRKLCFPPRTRILAEKRSPVQQARLILRREPFGNWEHRCPTTTNHRLHPATINSRNKKKRE